ncbi:MAG: GGDEF domain-containing protein [Myxococcales bacterium FL481]|nr:MAG: GGDEF domain-containing protein [Myxococcales bacterium FL481]
MSHGSIDVATLDLPSPPRSLAAIVQAASDPEASAAALAELVAADPGFSTKILAIANSSLYRRGAPVTSVAHAVGVLGIRQLRNLALCAAAQASVDKRRLGAFHLSRFWENSLRRAVAARVLAEGTNTDPMLAFTAGLLQDLGVLALMQTWPDRASEWMRVETELPDDRLEHERALFGLGHDEVAPPLAERWALPDDLAAAMAHHHRDATAEAHAELSTLSRHAEVVATVLAAADRRAALERARLILARERGLDRSAIDDTVARVGREVAEMAGLLGVKVKVQPELETIREAAFSGLQRLNLSYEQLVAHLETSLATQDRLATELRARNAQLERAARTDALTDLPNRRAFWSTLVEHLESAHEADDVGLLLVDADHFKAVNDSHGHEVGDAVLVHLARVLEDGVSEDELVARIGGEEFAVVYVAREADFGHNLGERLIARVQGTPCEVPIPASPLELSISIGAASVDAKARAGESATEAARSLYRVADARLYRAKDTGRGRVVSDDQDRGRGSGWLARLRGRAA